MQAPDREGGDPFSLVTVAGLLAVGIAAFCAFLVLAAYAPDWRGDERGGANALSPSAVGYAGLVDLLRAMDVPASINRTDLARVSGSAFLIVTPPPGTLKAQPSLQPDRAPVLMVLPKWEVRPDRDHPGWVERTGLLGLSQIASAVPAPIPLSRRSGPMNAVLHGGGEPFSGLEEMALGPIDDWQVIDTAKAIDKWTPILLDEAGATVLARLTLRGGRPFYVLSDPDILNTHGLKSRVTAEAAIDIIGRLRGEAPVVIDVTLDGLGRSPNLLRLMFEPPLLGATICAAGMAVLMLSMAVRRFGPVLTPPRVLDFGKRALAENAATLIAMAGRERGMALPYAEIIRARALRDIGAPPHLGRVRAERVLDEAGAARGLPTSFSDLLREASAAATPAAVLAVAGRLFQWGRGLRRGHR